MTKVTIPMTQLQRPFAPCTKHEQPNISGVINMLTITDLHNEQELSSFEMGNVAGGMPIDQMWGMYNAAKKAQENPNPSGDSDTAIGIVAGYLLGGILAVI
jgi:hypothetical protein